MLKKIILFTSLGALIACSEDAIQGIDHSDENTEIPMGTNSFNDGDPGQFGYGPGSIKLPGGNYASPWDIWLRTQTRPGYVIINGSEIGSGYTMIVTPWVGLAYYDGNDNGLYTDVATNTIVANLTTPFYTNLFANGHEVGNLIRANSIIMDGTTLQECEVTIDSNIEHLPVNQVNLGSGWNPLGRTIDLQGVATPQEIALLAQYGKVFFYEVEIIHNATATVVYNGTLQLENIMRDVGATGWDSNIPTGVFPDGSIARLYYYNVNSPTGTQWTHNPWTNPDPATSPLLCDSREVVFEKGIYQHEEGVNLVGVTTPGRVSMTITQGDQLWLTSAVVLRFSTP